MFLIDVTYSDGSVQALVENEPDVHWAHSFYSEIVEKLKYSKTVPEQRQPVVVSLRDETTGECVARADLTYFAK